jgi:thioesterase domain-containing protein/acyl carrier protein
MHGAHVSFDAMLFEVWGALLNGARLEVVDKEVLIQPDALGALLASRKVSVMFLTTSLFNFTSLTCPRIFGGIRHLVVGGEAANAECMRRVLQSGSPPAHLINGYGPTEATTFTTWFRVGSVPADVRTLPIGRPIRRATVHLLDSQLQPVSPGEVGEIHIGGVGVASGYWRRPELNTERFRPDPFNPNEAGLLYRTGDLARLRPDGNIEFLGRMDHQVKIRGNRIEVGEIESLILEHPAILECSVIAEVEEGIARRLVAFVVPRTPSPQSEDPIASKSHGLIPWLRDRLPPYMVPAQVVIRSSLPRTATGKIDRRNLEATFENGPASQAAEPSAKDKVTASATENLLRGIWRGLLPSVEIDPTASFFDQGGDSLLAVQMFLRVQQQTGALVPLESWLESPSLRTLADQVDARLQPPSSPPALRGMAPEADAKPQVFLVGWLLNLSSEDVSGLPCYVLPFPEGGHSAATSSVEHLSAGCLAAMDSIPATGPRILVGYSLGGLVAIEMARRMEAAGMPPAEVWLIDSTPAPWPHRLGPAVGQLAGRLGMGSFPRQLLISRAIHSLADIWMPFFQGRLHEWIRRGQKEFRRLRLRQNRTLPPSSSVSAPENHHPHVWANNSYRVNAYHGPVRLFITRSTMEDAPRPGRGWAPMLSRLEEVPIQGDHFTCIQQDRESLVSEIQSRLDRLHHLIRSSRS